MRLLNHLALPILFILLFSACEKQSIDESIEGVYEGVLTPVDIQSANTENAQANVTIVGDHLIEVHCYSESLDTIFQLNYYKNYDEYMVCLTGEDFLNMYGHNLYHQNMGPGMMRNNTEWMYHLEYQHASGDEHFGKFNMADHSFEYLFEPNDQNHTMRLHFRGFRH